MSQLNVNQVKEALNKVKLLVLESFNKEVESRSTIGGVKDTTIPSPGWSSKQPLPGIGLHDPLHGRLACPEFTSFHQGVGQICPREGLFRAVPS